VITHGAKKTKKRYIASAMKADSDGGETTAKRKGRRIMAYALPVAVATWLVLGWFHILKPMSGIEKNAINKPVPVARS
jgi:hypothetical protein